MKTIIHDLDDKAVIKMKFDSKDKVFNSNKCLKSCIGCFSCWIKHPTHCIYKDSFSHIPESIKDSDELVLISQNHYGTYSDTVKRVLERCIGYVHPFFTIREGKIHHQSRYMKRIKFTVYIYGDITTQEKETFNDLVKANSINLNSKEYEVIFLKNIKELKNVYTH